MAKLVLSFSLILIVFFIHGMMAEAKMCTDGLGLCGQDCDARCKTKHQGQNPQGNCDSSLAVPLCYCYYDCQQAPPKGKTCSIGLGVCSVEHCKTKCCNDKCASKYNQGQGYCDMLGSSYYCKCDYSC